MGNNGDLKDIRFDNSNSYQHILYPIKIIFMYELSPKGKTSSPSQY
jgi:hypothetical protein